MTGLRAVRISLPLAIFAGLALYAHAAEELRVALTTNRTEYLEYEPIFVEWTISNISTAPVALADVVERGFCIHYVGLADGKRTLDPVGLTVDFDPPESRPLQSGACIKGWTDLRQKLDIPGTGKCTVSAVLDTTPFRGAEGLWVGAASSSDAAFAVNPAAGHDAKAVELVKTAISAGRVSGYDALHNENLSIAIVTLTRSERFLPVARFYYGMAQFRILDEPGGGGVTVERLAEAGGSFQECAERTDNHYLKGLARYYNLRTRAFDPDTLPYEQAEKMVAEILKDHPGTYAAWKAPEVLEKLKAAKKKPDAK